VLAEWQLLRARVLRTRLSLWLALLGGGLGWLALRAGGGAVALEQLALRLGALSAVLCVAFGAGSDLDRAALRLTLTHPTTPTAVAAGRWLGATTVATIVTLAATTAVAGDTGAAGGVWLRALAAGVGTAGATAGCALFVVALGGNALAGALFFYMLLLSGLHPAGLEPLMAPGVWRTAATAILEVTPALWRYRGLAAGAAGAWLHALAWMAGGVVAAGLLLRPRGR
jgi:uncharacterized protein YjeT (DUF2065 family)